jgi:hypothetical protein
MWMSHYLRHFRRLSLADLPAKQAFDVVLHLGVINVACQRKTRPKKQM